jgi:TRAP-type C4-dicarboxylate transport system permease small subunit
LKVLHRLAKLFAILAGLLMTLITLMTCASLIGRNFLEMSLTGDFELTGVATGAAIALFMPYCQAKRGNIIVDFFTAQLSPAKQGLLDRFGTLLLALLFALLAWRTALGGVTNPWFSAVDGVCRHGASIRLDGPDWLWPNAVWSGCG